jgi:hypothetical protein
MKIVSRNAEVGALLNTPEIFRGDKTLRNMEIHDAVFGGV